MRRSHITLNNIQKHATNSSVAIYHINVVLRPPFIEEEQQNNWGRMDQQVEFLLVSHSLYRPQSMPSIYSPYI